MKSNRTRKSSRTRKSKKSSNKQRGGAGMFFIFTTGIFADGAMESLDFWTNVIENRIITLIRSLSLSEIHIVHSDILESVKMSEKKEVSDMMSGIIKRNVLNNDIVYNRTFTMKPLDFEMIQSLPHILYDFAHLLKYEGLNLVSYDRMYNLCSIYIGYTGEANFERLIAYTDYVGIIDGKLVTYIDMLFKKS